MEDVIVGLLAIAIGALFCFRGWLMLRIIIPIWGAFAGFVLGAGLVANIGNEGFLSSVLGWAVGVVVAVIFGLIAYLYYEVSVVIAMAAIGFSISTSVLVALGITWSWLTILSGVALGVILALVAIVGNLPMVILTVLSAAAGASTIVGGLMLMFGVVDASQFSSPGTTEALEIDWWWYGLYIVLAIAGIIAQVRLVDRLTGSMRDSWVESGGKELRTG